MKARDVPHNLNQTQNDYQPSYIVFNHNRYVGLLKLENTMNLRKNKVRWPQNIQAASKIQTLRLIEQK